MVQDKGTRRRSINILAEAGASITMMAGINGGNVRVGLEGSRYIGKGPIGTSLRTKSPSSALGTRNIGRPDRCARYYLTPADKPDLRAGRVAIVSGRPDDPLSLERVIDARKGVSLMDLLKVCDVAGRNDGPLANRD